MFWAKYALYTAARTTLFDKDVVVRRNTATVLGLTGKPGAIRLLKSAYSG